MKILFRQILHKAVVLFPLIFFAYFSKCQSHIARSVNIPNGRCAGYWEYLPANYTADTTTRYPLLIYIHGAGSYGNGTSSALNLILREGVTRIINLNLFPTTFLVNGQPTSFIVISPQFFSKQTPQETNRVIDFIINQGYRIDLNRIYLTGFSQGGDGAWKAPYNLAAAQRLAGLIPVAGYNNPYTDTTAQFIAAGQLPVWAVHSPIDGVPVVWTTNMVNKINSFTPVIPPVYTMPAGLTHDITQEVVYNPGYRPNGKNFYEWCLQYTRSSNAPPVANAGADITISYPERQVNLSSSGSSDPENAPLIFNWTKIAGPTSFIFNSTSPANPLVTNLVAGIYQFELKVTDDAGNQDKDTIRITVINPEPNQLPAAYAGVDTTIFIPENSILLSGSGSVDPDGSVETYEWTKISGPSQFVLSTPSLVNTSLTGLRAGIYKFRLYITDNQGGNSADTLQITVINNLPNLAPVANAGTDQTITLPLTTTVLNAAASADPDGVIIQYQWRQVAGPTTAIISNPGNLQTPVNSLGTGTYLFELTITDDSSAYDKDSITVVVNPVPPVSQRVIKVNIFGGAYPAGTGWNNWNVQSILAITNIIYADSSASPVTASLNVSNAIADNGANYPVTMCPLEVGRTASYSTVKRLLTLSGLDNTKMYNLEIFASRNGTGNSTKFSIGSSTVTVLTDRNYSNKAVFNNITPVTGQIKLNIERINSYNYINGFILSETGTGTPVNQPPICLTGNNQSIVLPVSQVILNGSASYDPDGSIVDYTWEKISGPNGSISNANAAIATVSGMTAGIYVFQLTVTDNNGISATANIQVDVSEAYIPVAVADSLNCGKIFKIVVLGSSTAMGTGANPVDSSWVNKLRFYVRGKNNLSQVINLAVSGLTTYHTLNPTGFVQPPGRPATDTNRNITKALSYNPDLIIINLPSNDNASNFPIQEQKDNYERAIALAVERNIPVWVSTTQPRNNFSAAQVSNQLAMRDWTLQRFGEKSIDFWTNIANADGTINELYNADGIHLKNAGHHVLYSRTIAERLLDTLCIRKNIRPVANAGSNTLIMLPVDSVQLSSNGSNDPDGLIVAYQWSKISGASCIINTPFTPSPIVTSLIAGVYQFQLKVTDNFGAETLDTVLITVTSSVPQSPVAKAGADIQVILPADSAQLNGSESFDPDGTILTYRWYKLSGPNGGFNITDSMVVNPSISGLIQGTYYLKLTVTDDSGLTDTDTVVVTVYPVPNQPPSANAGNDITVNYPGTGAQLNGSASIDPDGSIAAYQWTKISGPIPFAINDSAIANPLISGLAAGVYVMELIITDNEAAIDKDTVTVIVQSPPNEAPLANAGNDNYMVFPVNSIQLNGMLSTDPDGVITMYSWRRITGPLQFVINNPVVANPVITNLISGIYTFELTVTDNNNAVAKDSVIITVFPPVNTFPIANAGPDQQLTLPVNTSVLNGTASSDLNGIISSYQWQQVSGPSTALISSPLLATTNISNITEGTYQFELLVTDDSAAVDRDTVIITVNPAPIVTQKFIKVNIYGGTFPAGAGWNNWNVTGNLTLGSSLYSDGSLSPVRATLNISNSIADNGANYPVTMCPVEVGRTTSYSTVVRALTLSGLNNSLQYDLEVFASRSGSGNSTRFIQGSSTVTINTGNNFSNKAVFTNISPVNGQIVLRIERVNTYNYINGFILTENNNLNNRSATPESFTTETTITEQEVQYPLSDLPMNVFPNPVGNETVLQFRNQLTGNVSISIINQYGKIVSKIKAVKIAPEFNQLLRLHYLPSGIYFIQLQIGNSRKMIKILKRQD